jgi:hypothetical protein
MSGTAPENHIGSDANRQIQEERRKFLRRAGKAALTAPAAALLLSIAAKRANADVAPLPSGTQLDAHS